MRPATEQLDRRYSDEKAQAVPRAAAETRAGRGADHLDRHRPADGRPHATPNRAYGHDKRDPFDQTNYRY
ncbi:MAG TPA: hypothetical protein VFQ15_07185 [Jiangellaceae bacterium]|nr:hypothetical protein [Jiangellaceae bacterium]